MRWKNHLRRVRDEFHFVYNVEKIHFVLFQRRKRNRNIRNHLKRELRVKLPDSFRSIRYIIHVCSEMPVDNQKKIVTGMHQIVRPRINGATVCPAKSRDERIEIRSKVSMFLQRRKNIQGYSPFLKTAHIPLDQFADFFMLCQTIYHKTSFVGFRDKFVHNMSVFPHV